jgi:hypothetical protein
MANGKSQFYGLAGQYYVAYCLAIRHLHAAITMGNAPHVDILVASPDGSGSLSLQVKARWSGCRCKWYGHEVWQWDVGAGAVGLHSPTLWYAFVEFENQVDVRPTVFLVPSLWVADTIRADWTRMIYPLKIECEKLCKERWDLIPKFLAGDPDALAWATTMPPEAKL